MGGCISGGGRLIHPMLVNSLEAPPELRTNHFPRPQRRTDC